MCTGDFVISKHKDMKSAEKDQKCNCGKIATVGWHILQIIEPTHDNWESVKSAGVLFTCDEHDLIEDYRQYKYNHTDEKWVWVNG